MILRRLRGIVGTGAFWTLIWLPLGVAVNLLQRPTDFGPPPIVWVPIWGGISGALFAIVLTVAERRHTLSELSLARVAIWGALGSAALPAFMAIWSRMEYSIDVNWSFAIGLALVCAALGATCAVATLSLARRGPRS